MLLHSCLPKWGLRAFNVLGVFKVVILGFIVLSGFAALGGKLKVPKPETLQDAFKWHGFGGGIYNYSTALLRVIYSYKGYAVISGLLFSN